MQCGLMLMCTVASSKQTVVVMPCPSKPIAPMSHPLLAGVTASLPVHLPCPNTHILSLSPGALTSAATATKSNQEQKLTTATQSTKAAVQSGSASQATATGSSTAKLTGKTAVTTTADVQNVVTGVKTSVP